MKKKLFIILSICVILPMLALLSGSMKIGAAVILNYCTHNNDFPTSTSVDGYAVCDPGDYGGYHCQGCSLTSDYYYLVTADVGWYGRWYVGSGTDHYKSAWSQITYFTDYNDIWLWANPECGHGISG